MLDVVALAASRVGQQPAGADVLGSWTLTPISTVAVALVAVGYLAGRRRLAAAGTPVAAYRVALFVVGLVLAVLAVDAWPGVYARGLLSVYASQAVVLLLLVPPLLALAQTGRVLGALRRSRSHSTARTRPVAAVLAHPMVGPLLVPIILGLLFYGPLLPAVVAHGEVADVVDVALLGLGYLIAAPLAAVIEETSLAVGLLLFVGLIELLLDAIPGIVLRLDAHVLPGAVTLAARRSWGPTALHDQQLAGAIIWAVAEFLDLPFLGLLLVRWTRADAAEAARVDAGLDAAEQAARLRQPVSVAEATQAAPAPAVPDRTAPWWETEPNVFDDRRAAKLRRPDR